MIVKEVLNEELLTLAEVKEILSKITEERREKGLRLDTDFENPCIMLISSQKPVGKSQENLLTNC